METDWERAAGSWIEWARAPEHDPYWYYRDSFFDVLPAAGARTLDLGCGEGRVARDLAVRGHRVAGVDTAPTLVGAAREADPDGAYLVADAACLPFADDAFDLVVAYNSLMDIPEMPLAVAECARVLRPGGHLCICVTHPLNDAGAFDGPAPDAPFVINGSYFGRRRYDQVWTRSGLTMHARGWAYALHDYARAVQDAGLLIEALREPTAAASPAGQRDWYARWTRIPMFLLIRAVLPSSTGRRRGSGECS